MSELSVMNGVGHPGVEERLEASPEASPRRRWLRRLARCVLALAFLAMTSFGYAVWEVHRYAHLHSDVDADAIIVLGAAAWGSEPSPVFRERINHAIRLYEDGRASVIIFTGGRRLRTDMAEAEVARDYAVAQGVPPEAILIETRSSTTLGNLEEASAVARARGLGTFLLVSDPLHMRRAMLMADDLDMAVASAPTPTSRYQSWSEKGPFLLREAYLAIGYRAREALQR